MSEDIVNEIIDKINNVLDKNSPDVAFILKILSKQEKEHLNNILSDRLIEKSVIGKDIALKTEALNSLILFLLNNPRIKSKLREDKKKENELFNNLYKAAYSLFLLRFDKSETKDYTIQLRYLVIGSLYAILADKNVEIDSFLQKNFPWKKFEEYKSDRMIEDLEVHIYLLVLKLIGRIKDLEDIRSIEQKSKKCLDLLEELQKKEITNEINITNAFHIAGYANLCHVINVVSKYLIKFEIEQNLNINNAIDTYSYNAEKLFNSEDTRHLIDITKLLNYSLKRLCENSIWTLLDRTPKIKKFVQNLSSKKDGFILSLLPSQRDSVIDILSAKRSIVLNMPTSSGKTLLAELYIINVIEVENVEEKPTIAYIVPTNALVNQTKHRLKNELSPFNLRIETTLPFYEMDEIEDEVLKEEHIDILVSTPEKLDFLIRKEHPSLKNLKAVILDEAHNLSEKTRGSKFELLLATLKQRRRGIRFLLLSPFLKNADHIALWLGDTERDSQTISIEWSPTKQFVGGAFFPEKQTKTIIEYYPTARNNLIKSEVCINLNTNPTIFKNKIGEQKINYIVKSLILAEKYLKIGNIIFLCKGPLSAEKLANKAKEYFFEGNQLRDISDDEDIKKVITLIEMESDPKDPLISCLRRGIAYHHSNLPSVVKEEIERLTSIGKIKFIAATTTLAQGMDFPITSIIFNTTKLGGGRDITDIDNNTFWNMAGRAGRAYKDIEGHILINQIGKTESELKNILIEYIKKDTKEFISSLNKFFSELEHFEFDYNFIEKYPEISNFLQYLNHILHVGYSYKLDDIDMSRIVNILSSTLIYKELDWFEGYARSQEKIRNFSRLYIDHLKEEKINNLKLADIFGISDISMKRFYSYVYGLSKQIEDEFGKEDKNKYLHPSKIIIESKEIKDLAEIVRVMSKVPEWKIFLKGKGRINCDSIASIIIGWVNGKKVNEIAEEIKYEYEDLKTFTDDCQKYINSNLKNYVPWGISVFQQLMNDTEGDNAENLPSYIYYGVNDKPSVILSKIGVPRFAVKELKRIIEKKHPDIEINVKNMKELGNVIKNISMDELYFPKEKKVYIKKIICERI